MKKPMRLPKVITLSFLGGLVLVAGALFVADTYHQSTIAETKVNLANKESLRDFTIAKGGAWAVSDYKYSLVNPVIAANNAVGNANISLQKIAFSGDWKFSVRAKGNSYADGANFGLVFGYKSAEEYYFVNFSENKTDMTNGIFQVDANGQKRIATFADTIKANRHYDIAIERTRSSVKISQEGKQVGAISVGDIDNRQVGFSSNGGTADYIRITMTQDKKVAEQKPPVNTEAPAVPAPATPAPAPAPEATTPVPSPTPAVTSTGYVIRVSTSAGLVSALANVKPGQTIRLADGVYQGNFVASTPATQAKPIILMGTRAAILNGGSIKKGYVLHLKDADYWKVDGISVKNGQKGIMSDGVNNTMINNVEVSETGHEAVHFRAFSTDNTVQNSYIHDTGKLKADYGEGVYLGTARSNWKTYSSGKIDTSDRNSVIGNRIEKTAAESIDIKEGTTGGIIRGNILDGAGMTGAYADSWIDLKGNEYLIEGNKGVNAPVDGMQTHVIVEGWGVRNTFSANEMNLSVKGYGIRLQTSKGGTSNIIKCNNKVIGAELGLANIACKP
jgi:biotin carboxyl carrier protein